MSEIECRFYAPLSGLCNAETNIDSGYKYYCKNCDNCYYKQLQILKQENEKLKEAVEYHNLVECPSCGYYSLPQYVCHNCGYEL